MLAWFFQASFVYLQNKVQQCVLDSNEFMAYLGTEILASQIPCIKKGKQKSLSMFSYDFFSMICNNMKIASYSITSHFAKTATDLKTSNTEQPTHFRAQNNSCHQLCNFSCWQLCFYYYYFTSYFGSTIIIICDCCIIFQLVSCHTYT